MHKVPLTVAMLRDAIALVRGAVAICYPMGLPHYDPVHRELTGLYSGTRSSTTLAFVAVDGYLMF